MFFQGKASMDSMTHTEANSSFLQVRVNFDVEVSS
jgi:hypothetical protein